MFSRKVKYEATADASNLDDLSRKLAVDLRKHVRKLDSCPPLSKEWLAMIDSLLHISNIAMMEHRLPREDDSATLWEGEELTVRFLLEEGKLNLCLRLMHDFKKYQRTQNEGGQATAAAATAAEMDAATLQQRALVFEQALSVLLKCAFEHVEPLQTVDMPELVEHCAEVLDHCASRAPGDVEFTRTQESAVPLYLASVAKRLEALDESRVMALIKGRAIFPRILRYASVHGEVLQAEAIDACAAFANAILETEDYATHKKVYLPDTAELPALAGASTAGTTVPARTLLVDLKVRVLREATDSAEAKRNHATLVREADGIERLARLKAG
mmetsp:Transcript_20590/g.55516  ORF Transcript_20590/g.55516 Transcript_20590/m.55516 type:complete len:329 (-) Transcript_20590:307-1293(-)